jgi:hypothetical protein
MIRTIATAIVFAGGSLFASEVLLFQESFETDGAGTRYTVIGGGDNGELQYFNRRKVGTIGTKASGGTLDGEWMFAGAEIDKLPAPRSNVVNPKYHVRDGVLIFENIDISGMGNLRIMMAAATGFGQQEADNPLFITVRFDGGDWIEIGGFRPSSSNAPPLYFAGPRSTLTRWFDPRLFSRFLDWEWEILGSGQKMDLEIIMNSNHWPEEYYIDNIRLFGQSGVKFFTPTVEHSSFIEPVTGTLANSLTITLAEPAPTGGATFQLVGNYHILNSVDFGANGLTVFVPAGQTFATVPFDIVQDNHYTGTERLEFLIYADGYNTERVRMTMENTTPKPNIMITEVFNVHIGADIAALHGDANNDGVKINVQEQFIEFVNFEDYPVDITGWTLSDDFADRHEFADGTYVLPNQAVVVFGEGKPSGTFGGAIVMTTTAGGNGLGYNNTGATDEARIWVPGGLMFDKVVMPTRAQVLAKTQTLPTDQLAYNEGASMQRTDFTPGSPFNWENTIHSLIPEANYAMFSPGTKADGSPYFTPENVITLTISAESIREDDGPNAATGTITLSNPAPAGGLTVFLETNGVAMGLDGSFQPDEIDLDSLTVVVPEGQGSATFRIGAHNDNVLDGDRVVSIYARSGPYVLPGFAKITVLEVDTSNYNIVINEVFVDVKETGEDPNLDGFPEDDVGDQFIELVNVTGRAVNMSGWTLDWDNGGAFAIPRLSHKFPLGTWVPEGGSIVVFGSISDAAAADSIFGGAVVQTARDEFGIRKLNGVDLLTTENAFMKLRNRHGFLISEFDVTAAMMDQNQSVTRWPDITGDLFLHVEAAGGFVLFSPGTMVDGTPFAGNGGPIPNFARIFPNVGEPQADGKTYLDPTFGFLYTVTGGDGEWNVPWVYVYDIETYWYVLEATGTTGASWHYDVDLEAWFYTSYAMQPWSVRSDGAVFYDRVVVTP